MQHLIRSLKELLQEHLEQGRTFESFHIPYDYEPGRRYDLTADNPPVIPDRYVQQSATIQQAKERLPPWLWKVCNTELNRVFSDGMLPVTLSPEREQAMHHAMMFAESTHPRYADRPKQYVLTVSFWNLRTVLCTVPAAPERNSDQWGTEITNLRWLPDEQRYDWSVEFTERVLKALCALVKADGLDEKGWKTARWKVYRQVCDRSLSIYVMSSC